jgi:hypothetical protein
MYYYYIIKIHDSRVKVGITKNTDQRIKSYRTSDPTLSYYKIYKLDIEKKDVLYIERLILYELKRWFTCRSETVESSNIENVEIIVDGLIDELYVQKDKYIFNK